MSFNKSVQKIFFMLAISISAVLLCLVGVWAATMNLNFQGKVSPDIHCKINAQYMQTIDGNSSSINKEIFNNNNGAQVGMPTTSGNTLKNLNIQLSGDVTTAVTFQLTNYTPNKYIRLSVASISGATIKSGDVAVCPPASQSTTPQTMTIHIAGASQASATINLKVEEVYKVQLDGTGLATATTNYYFSPNDDCNITIEPMIGYQLPTTLSVANSPTTKYRIDENDQEERKNTKGIIAVDKDDIKGNNVIITANCNQIFEIKQSGNKSMLDNITNDNQATAINENSKVYVDVYKKTIKTNESQTTTSELEIRFNDTNAPTAGYEEETTEGNTTTTLEYVTTKEVTSGQYFEETIQDTTYLPNNGHYYRAKGNDGTTYIILKNDTENEEVFTEYPYYVEMGLYPQTEYDAAPSGTYEQKGNKYYLYETIKWIVLGTVDGTNLNTLHFKQFDDAESGMLYTDGACGKPYTGQLVLMSAYVLDSSAFHTDGQTMVYSGSTIITHLENNLVKSSTGTNGMTLKNAAKTSEYEPQGQYLKMQTLTSTNYTSDTTHTLASDITTAFFLPGGTTGENFVAEKYFNVAGIYEGVGQATYNVGVASSTDYAIANGVKDNTFTYQLQQSTQTIEATALRGWDLDSEDTTTTTTSAYWTRSGGGHNGAIAINMNAIPQNVLVSNTNVGVRPMMVLDLGFYENGTYTA